jgi:acetyl esterase/lipase
MKTLILLFLFMNTVPACKQEPEAFAKGKDLPEKTMLNVSYGTDSLQTMDVYLPANRSAEKTKSLILVHGGGWTSGSKADFAAYLDSFKTRLPHYAIFNINYRLANGGHLFPAQEHDVKAAVDFIVENAEDYNVSNDRFSLLGFSAGAHLALLQAYKYTSPKIKAVVDYFGPTDLVAMYQRPWHPLVPLALQMITGTTPEKNSRLFEEASPANYVSESSPPTLILHGAKDVVVNVSQSKLLADKLKASGVKHELRVYPNEGHGRWYGQALVSSFDRIETFLKENTQ